MQDFRKLRVWDAAMRLSVLCYSVTGKFPSDERYGLTSQMRRSSVSIASNIAEGCGRDSQRELVRFLRISYGSACELETQARLALAVGLGHEPAVGTIVEDSEEVRRMLSGLIRTARPASS